MRALRLTALAAGAACALLAAGDGTPAGSQGTYTVPLPPPTLFVTANAEPVDGKVFVSLPPAARARAAGLKGRRFVPLTEPRQIPIGSVFDTRQGRVRIATATPTPDVEQVGRFFAGFFELAQDRGQKGITEARLMGGDFSGCPKSGKARSAKKRLSDDVVRALRGNVKGRYRTSGRFAAATVRGTIYSIRDRCDGTLARVTRGAIVVRDLRARRDVTVTAGEGKSSLRQHLVRKR